MSVPGLGAFRDAMAGHEGSYALIGGSACDLLLDDDCYALLVEGLTVVEGVSALDEAHLIPLKMRAHVDLNDKHDAGGRVNGADLRKRRKDVLRLLEFAPDDAALDLPDRVKADAERFVAIYRSSMMMNLR